MSLVYLGYDTANGRHVAVKLLADHLAADPTAVRRFSREARFSRQLVHPALVRGLASGRDPDSGRHFLVLEYVDGPSAQTRLHAAGPLPLSAVARVAQDVGAAVRHLHDRGLVHRDVKPDNILLAQDGSAKLIDLGLARRVKPGAGGDPPAAAGTPHYMPPEQVLDGDRADPRSDLYALGATLYHLLTGRLPFDGDTQDELLRAKVGGEVRPPSAVRADLPPAVDPFLLRLLAADPADRYQTAGEFLTAAEAHLGPPAAVQPAFRPEPPPDPLADTDPGRTHIDLPPVPPSPTRSVAGLLLLAAALAAGLAARWAAAPPPEPSHPAASQVADWQARPRSHG